MGEHTAGPWQPAGPNLTAGPKPDYYYSVLTAYEPGGGDDEICELSDWPKARDEQNANAQLIAAAPRMKIALQRLLTIADRCKAENVTDADELLAACIEASDALDEAEGQDDD